MRFLSKVWSTIAPVGSVIKKVWCIFASIFALLSAPGRFLEPSAFLPCLLLLVLFWTKKLREANAFDAIDVWVFAVIALWIALAITGACYNALCRFGDSLALVLNWRREYRSRRSGPLYRYLGLQFGPVQKYLLWGAYVIAICAVVYYTFTSHLGGYAPYVVMFLCFVLASLVAFWPEFKAYLVSQILPWLIVGVMASAYVWRTSIFSPAITDAVDEVATPFGILLIAFLLYEASKFVHYLYSSSSSRIVRLLGYAPAFCFHVVVVVFGLAVFFSAISGVIYYTYRGRIAAGETAASHFNTKVLPDVDSIWHILNSQEADSKLMARALANTREYMRPEDRPSDIVCPVRQENEKGRSVVLEIGKEIPCGCVDKCTSPNGNPSVGDFRELTYRAVDSANPDATFGKYRVVSGEQPYRHAVRINITRVWKPDVCFFTEVDGGQQAKEEVKKLIGMYEGEQSVERRLSKLTEYVWFMVAQGPAKSAANAELDGRSVLPRLALLSEDMWFPCHLGTYPPRLFKSVISTWIFHEIQGGSTIPMQLAKNLFTNAKQTPMRKLLDIVNAGVLEWKNSKAEIMEMYLNTIYLGHGVYGVDGGSRYYFGTGILDILPEQAAILVSLFASPERDTPYSARQLKHFDKNCPVYAPHCGLMRRNVQDLLSAALVRQTWRYRPFYPVHHELAEEVIAKIKAKFVEPLTDFRRPEQTRKGWEDFVKSLGIQPRPRIEQKPGWYQTKCVAGKCYAAHDDGYYYTPIIDASGELSRGKTAMRISRPGLLPKELNYEEGEKVLTSSFIAQKAKNELLDSGVVNGFTPVDAEVLLTVDSRIQRALTLAVQETLESHRAKKGYEEVLLKAVAVANDGRILAAASGSRDGLLISDFLAQMNRPIGSAAKPHVYGAGIEWAWYHGQLNLLEHVVSTLPVLDDKGEDILPPEGCQFGQSRTSMTVREAIGYSCNRPVLAFLLWLKQQDPQTCAKIGQNLRDLGYSFDDAQQKVKECETNPRTFVLGGGNWPFMDEVRGYAIVANGGTPVKLWVVDRVFNLRAKHLEQSVINLAPQVVRDETGPFQSFWFKTYRDLLTSPILQPGGTLNWLERDKHRLNLGGMYLGGKTGSAGSLKSTGGVTDAVTFLIAGQVVIAVHSGRDEYKGVPGNTSLDMPRDVLRRFFGHCKKEGVDLHTIQPRFAPGK